MTGYSYGSSYGSPQTYGLGSNYGLSFNDATQNGSSLSNTQIGVQQAAMAPLGTTGNLGGAVQGVDVTSAFAPGTNTQGTFSKNADNTFNTDNIKLLLGGVQMLGSLWNSFQQNKIAKEQLSLARETFQTNLENNRKTYNSALEDRIRSRYVTEGRSSAEADAYLQSHNL